VARGGADPRQGGDDIERFFAQAGEELADRVAQAVPGWVVRSVMQLFDAWTEVTPGARDPARRAAVMAEAHAASARAGSDVSDSLRRLLGADIDAQRATPLELVRRAVSYPTAVLAAAGVPPVERDGFAEERFPGDVYGLTPASLAALDPSLPDLAVRWGAAKAAAHRRRHA